MRMIDRFRTPKQREIIDYLERNRLCRVSDVGDISNYHRHFRALLEEGVIYICGYVGCYNCPVYALVRTSVRNPSDCSQAQGGVLEP